MTKPDALNQKKAAPQPESRVKTVLLADDEPENLRSISEILEDLGYRVLGFSDARTALSSIRDGERPDLVITDYQMPGMNGVDFVAALRGILPGVPVIMMTAFGDLDTYFKSFSLGVFEYIHKPVTKGEFERIVKAALGETRKTRSASHADSQ